MKAPLLVSWQLTRDCDLACVHCCTESAPGKRLAHELDLGSAVRIARELVAAEVPYVMLCGGEPLVVPHFLTVAETLGKGGVHLKIETNGQRWDSEVCARLRCLPIRSIQVSIDGDTQSVYGRQRAGGSLAHAHDTCRSVRAAGLPLEVTFAPTTVNIHEAEAVIARAAALGAFRFNTGRLMRIGTAARLWSRLCPDSAQYLRFRSLLEHRQRALLGVMELCFEPFTMADALRASLIEPPATLLVMPNGKVKVSAALPFVCADLTTDTIAQAWDAYRDAWRSGVVTRAVRQAIENDINHAGANRWRTLDDEIRLQPLEMTWT